MNKVELKKLLQDSIELLENGRNPAEVSNTVKDKLLELIDEKEVVTKKDTEKLIKDLSSNSKEKVVKEVEEVKEKDKEIDM